MSPEGAAKMLPPLTDEQVQKIAALLSLVKVGGGEPMNEHQSTTTSDFNRPPIVARICSVEGCERPHYALGLCQAHYGRQRRTNDQSAALATWSPRAAWTIPTAVEIKAEMFDALSAAREQIEVVEIEVEMFEAPVLLSYEVFDRLSEEAL